LPSLIYFYGIFLKPTAECQISTLIFEKKNVEGVFINIPWKIYQGRQSSCPPLAKLKVLPGSLTDLRARTLPSLIYFSWDIYRDLPPQFVFKYQNWYLTLCCGLEVLKPTAAVKYQFWYLKKKIWRGGLYKYPMKIYQERQSSCSPLAKLKVFPVSLTENWYLTLCSGLEVHYPTYALKSVKDPGNTFNLAKGGQELCRPWYIFYGIFIETPLHNMFSNIKIDNIKDGKVLAHFWLS
jgi:hypothetical protein